MNQRTEQVDLQPEGGSRWIRHHVWAPIFVILDPSEFDLRRMDVEPVVGKDRFTIHYQYHRQIIPIAQALRRLYNFIRRQRVQGQNELTPWTVTTATLEPLTGRQPQNLQ